MNIKKEIYLDGLAIQVSSLRIMANVASPAHNAKTAPTAATQAMFLGSSKNVRWRSFTMDKTSEGGSSKTNIDALSVKLTTWLNHQLPNHKKNYYVIALV